MKIPTCWHFGAHGAPYHGTDSLNLLASAPENYVNGITLLATYGPHGKDGSYKPIAFLPSIEVRGWPWGVVEY